jgi:hypothetical protein
MRYGVTDGTSFTARFRDQLGGIEMPVLQRDLEQLISSTRASDALAANALARLAALKQAQAKLRQAWAEREEKQALQEAIDRILEV